MPLSSHPAVSEPAAPSNRYPGSVTHDHKTISGTFELDWVVNATYNPYDLNGSFSIIFFLGSVPSDPKTWLLAPNNIGVVYAYVDRAPSGRRAGGRENVRHQGSVELTEAIGKHSTLTRLAPEGVVPYLTENLSWRVLPARPFLSSQHIQVMLMHTLHRRQTLERSQRRLSFLL